MPSDLDRPKGDGTGEHDDMLMEGNEPEPPATKLMGWLRWMLLCGAAFLAVGMWWSYAVAEVGRGGSAAMPERKYHCPMHPQIVRNEPGECPICHMTLEPFAPAPPPSAALSSGPEAPRTADSAISIGRPHAAPRGPASRATDPASRRTDWAAARPGSAVPGETPPGTAPITLTLDRLQAIGVRTVVVGESDTAGTLRVTAVVAAPEPGLAEVHVRTPGFVERVLVDQTGIAVRKQQTLFMLYSPEILQAESELLTALRWSSGDGSTSTAASSRRKLELLGMQDADIDHVTQTREPQRTIAVVAPAPGFVAKKAVVLGAYVTPEAALYEIQDLSSVYVIADVYPGDLGRVQVGTAGRFVASQRPEQAAPVRVDLIYPSLNADARTTRVRMHIANNKTARFRPGEYGSVTLATPSHKALQVPRDALIDTGLDTYVYVVERPGSFAPRSVVVGEEQGEMTSILAGVAAGDRVVSGATFLIDSESRLQAASAPSDGDVGRSPAGETAAPGTP